MAKKEFNPADNKLIIITGLLIVFGIIILVSSSTVVPKENLSSIFSALIHQITLGLIPGIILAVFLSRIDLEILKKKTHLLFIISLMLMAVVFLPYIGKKSGNAARWIVLGPLSIQPSEFLKIAFILYLASWLETKIKKKNSFAFKNDFKEILLAFLVMLGFISFLLYLQSDLGTLVVIVSTAVLIYFFSGMPLKQMVLIGILAVIALVIFIRVSPYRLERVMVFLNPEKDPTESSYQINQALFAVGSGKIFGLGLGMSQQKYLLPHSNSDSIFAILAEETGFLGSVFLIILFLLFLWRGYKIGKEAKNVFSRLTALGITSWIVIQAFINIASMINFFPLTGIPLPFISSGGSALLAELAGLGIMLNISRKN